MSLMSRLRVPRAGALGSGPVMFHQEEHVLDGAARAFWVDAWASEMEERGEARGWGGKDVMDLAPKTPVAAQVLAKRLVAAVEKTNDSHIGTLVLEAHDADEKAGIDTGGWIEYQRLFGHYMAMQALGHGVAWTDDHAEFGMRVPALSNDQLRQLVA